MGKCMSKDHIQDTVIHHISSPVRTDDGVGFALGRLSSSHQTRWVKYEEVVPSEEEKPVVCEGQVIMSRSSSRSYGLTFPQGHLVSCAAFVNGGSRRDSKECTCGHRRQSEGVRVLPSSTSPAQKQSLAIIQKLSPVIKAPNQPKVNRSAPENDVENIGARPVKLTFNSATKTRPALRETNVNVNVPAEVVETKSRKALKESRENVDVEDMLPRRLSPRGPLRPSLTEKEFQALDSPPTVKTPTKLSSAAIERTDEVMKSPVRTGRCPVLVSSPKMTSTNSLGSSLQSILSAISDPESTSLVEEVLLKASAAQSRCTDLETDDMAESKASHSPLSDDSDTESSVSVIDAGTPSKAFSKDSIDQSEDESPGNTPVTARSVRTRLPIEGEFCKEEKPLHWKASALYTNCLFEESPTKNPVKSADCTIGITKFTIGHGSEIDPEQRSEKLLTITGSESQQEALHSENTDVGQELKRKSVDEALSPRASTTPFKKVKSLTEKSLSSDLELPAPGCSSDPEPDSSETEKEVVTPAKDAVNPDNEIAPDVKAFLQTSKKVVLSLGRDSITDWETGAKMLPSSTDAQTSSVVKEVFSSNSLAAVFELETLLVTSDVRRMSGHGVEGLQIVGSELTELFSSNVIPSSVEGNSAEAASFSLPKSEASAAITNPRSLASIKASGKKGALAASIEAQEESRTKERATSFSQDPCRSETFELESLDFDSPTSRKKNTPQVSPAQAAGDELKPVRRTAEFTSGCPDSKSPVPLNLSTTTSKRRTALSCSTEPLKDPGSNREASALSFEDFQFLLDAAEGEEGQKVAGVGSASIRSVNTLASFGRSILQKLRDSLPTTPNVSLPSTPKMSACNTPLLSKASTPLRADPHANSVALSPEEIAEIWGAFEQSHLL